ncbi:MAG: hypothetical protein SF097_24110 [Acidobacteriota bacterium]|nr:hypothetical protein [Acidobacteriota bacterium]
MKFTLFLLFIVTLSVCGNNQRKTAQPTVNQRPIDLRQIQNIAGKGRVQDKDYNQIEMVDRLIALQTQAIPRLIEKLDDETVIPHHVMDYWAKVTVGDLALIILTDFFTDASWTRTTLPNVSWDKMLNRKNKSDSAEAVLRQYVRQHGRKTIKEKWGKIWKANRERLFWDTKEKCFKLK